VSQRLTRDNGILQPHTQWLANTSQPIRAKVVLPAFPSLQLRAKRVRGRTVVNLLNDISAIRPRLVIGLCAATNVRHHLNVLDARSVEIQPLSIVVQRRRKNSRFA